ncbi:hypothetical protein Q5P01_008147 [Channa striata]|uniref:CD40 n=1 Tax=Channa striata TaxID=64152 RepID=A0AA88N9R2_CHASR|nr:hypothetical protein Q5P01_008147 [Channa striata]
MQLTTGDLAAALLLVTVLSAAQPQCDPLTQYESGGQCCMMCGQGTSMSQISTCFNPQCDPCLDNEYQDGYTREPKCERQPYCDQHKNFEVVDNPSKTVKSICLCKAGFHCSDGTCITCVPHTECKPGEEAASVGNHTHDTKWTECGDGYHIRTNGTAHADKICEKTSRIHLAVCFSAVACVILILVAGLVYWLCRGKVKGSVKVCVESCHPKEPNERLDGNYRPITEPILAEETEKKPMLSEQFSTQEEGSTHEEGSTQEGHGMTPEENMDEESLELCNRTENGKILTQEKGKSETLSRQESQPHTVTNSFCGTMEI